MSHVKYEVLAVAGEAELQVRVTERGPAGTEAVYATPLMTPAEARDLAAQLLGAVLSPEDLEAVDDALLASGLPDPVLDRVLPALGLHPREEDRDAPEESYADFLARTTKVEEAGE